MMSENRHPRISEVKNDCLKLCVPTYKNEPLSSILEKLCAKIEANSSNLTFVDSETILFTKDGNNISATLAGDGAGSVTSVGLGDILNFATATGSPVTGSGTLGYTLISQAAHLVLAGPVTGSAVPTFRALAASDIPSLAGIYLTSLQGTANRIDTSGNTINISPTYIGQGSITTLGTISTGTWQGSAITDSFIASASNWNAKIGSLGAVGATPNANAASITGAVLNLQPASESFPGVMSTTTQKFSGFKTFRMPASANGFRIEESAGSASRFSVDGITGVVSNYQFLSQHVSIDSSPSMQIAGSGGGYVSFNTNAYIRAYQNPLKFLRSYPVNTPGNEIIGFQFDNDNQTGPLTFPTPANYTALALNFTDLANVSTRKFHVTGAGTIYTAQLDHALADTNRFMVWDANGYMKYRTGSEVSDDILSLAPIGAAPNANGASLSGGILNLQPASATQGGVVTASEQIFGGVKHFAVGNTDDIVFSVDRNTTGAPGGEALWIEGPSGRTFANLFSSQNFATTASTSFFSNGYLIFQNNVIVKANQQPLLIRKDYVGQGLSWGLSIDNDTTDTVPFPFPTTGLFAYKPLRVAFTNKTDNISNDVFTVNALGTGIFSNNLGFGYADPRDVTNTITLPTTASGIVHYNTASPYTSNYERSHLYWNANAFNIATEKLGTGVARAINFQTDGVTRMSILAAGNGFSLYGTTSGVISLVTQAAAGTYSWMYPTSAGSVGQVLTSAGGVGPMTWTTPAAGGGGVSSVTGTTNRISSTGGATPILDIDAAYVGQTSITTLGTIGTGVWNATAIAIGKGGAPTGGTTGQVLSKSSNASYDYAWTTLAGSGTVTSASVVTANGFAGSVANATTTPAITISTSISGLLKGNGTAISAATLGLDYSGGTSALATGIIKSTTLTGALTIAVAGDFPTLNQNTTGSAATLTTSRNIYGNAFNGSADVTGIIAGTYGGTGVNNSTRTMTYAGNITFAGAFTQTFTATANTSVTLPTSGTLATLAGSETLTNKSVNGVTLASGGSATLFLNQAGGYTAPAGGTTLTESDDALDITGTVLSTKTTPVVLTFGATTTWTTSNGVNAQLTMTGNSTLSIPSPQSGKSYLLEVTQDATGGRVLTLPGGGTAIINVAASAKSIITGYYNGTIWYWFGEAPASGFYTPTITNITNVTATSGAGAFYTKVGNIVTLNGQVNVTATTNAVNVEFEITLPIPSNLAAGAGQGALGTVGEFHGDVGTVLTNATNDRIGITYRASSTIATVVNFSLAYPIL